MRVIYNQDEMERQKRNLFIADLIGYKLSKDLDTTRKLQKLSEDKGFMGRIIDTASKSQSTAGMTLSSVLEGMKTAMSIDIFSFKVNGIDLFKMVDEKLSQGSFELEVYLNPLYLSSEIALKQSISPGFRKPNITEEYMTERMKKAGMAWLYGFEKQTKEYIDFSTVKKTILEIP